MTSAAVTDVGRWAGSDTLAGRRVHFMGAGGIGVSALMELAHARGAIVSGCDCSDEGQVAHLRGLGLDIQVGHSAAHVRDCDELVYTPAVPEDHPELTAARAQGKTINVRMKMLGRLLHGTRAICVTGSHGKTTTTWLTGRLLIEAGRDPTVLVGGVVPSLKSNFRLGRLPVPGVRPEFVLETDESDNRLFEVKPSIAIVTNIDNDHLEHYGSMDALQKALTQFMSSAAESGDPMAAMVGCGDDPRTKDALRDAASRTGVAAFDYGFEVERLFRAEDLVETPQSACFTARGPFGAWRDLRVAMPGRHYVLNAMAAIAVAWRLGVGEEMVRRALATCDRVGRRFEIKGECNGARIVDDYGHHPTELRATFRAARAASSEGRLAIVFQPHRYTRTLALMDDFADALASSHAERILLLPVYAASEAPIPGARIEELAIQVLGRGYRSVCVCKTRDEAVAEMRSWARPGDLVLTQGAGDVTKVGDALAS